MAQPLVYLNINMTTHTLTFTESELNTIDVTLRMRLFMIQLELNEPSASSEYYLTQLQAERERILAVLSNHEIFENFQKSYMEIFDDND